MENEAKTEVKTEEKHHPFKTSNGFEMASTAPKHIPSLVDGLLIEVGTSNISADPKSGKSTLVRQLMVDIAEDRPFLGMPTVCGDSLYLFLEGPLGSVQQHFKKLGHSGQRGQIHVIAERMPNNLPTALKRLSDTIKEHPNVRLVVVDPLSKLLRLGDSNSTDEVTPALEQLEAFAKKHGVHVMAVLHDKKRKAEDHFQNAAGSFSYRAGSDTNICVIKLGKERAIATEQRWGDGLEPTMLEFDKPNLTSRLGKTLDAVEEERQAGKASKTTERIEKEIRFALLGAKPLTTADVIEKVSGKTTTIIAVLAQMEKAGHVVAVEEGKAKRYSVPALPIEETKEDKGEEAA